MYKRLNHTMTVLLVQAASEFDRNICGFYLLIFYKMFHCIKNGEFFDIKQISFGSILLYFSEYFTSKTLHEVALALRQLNLIHKKGP